VMSLTTLSREQTTALVNCCCTILQHNKVHTSSSVTVQSRPHTTRWPWMWQCAQQGYFPKLYKQQTSCSGKYNIRFFSPQHLEPPPTHIWQEIARCIPTFLLVAMKCNTTMKLNTATCTKRYLQQNKPSFHQIPG